MNTRTTLNSTTLGLGIAVFCSSVSMGNKLIHDNFNDADYRNDIGVVLTHYQGPGSIDASSGDVVISEQDGTFSMWGIQKADGEFQRTRSEMSFRVRMTVNEILANDRFFAGIGTVIYNHGAIVNVSDELGIRTGTGGHGNEFVELPFAVKDQQVFLQLNMFEETLTSRLWKPSNPDSVVEVTYPYQPVFTHPSIGIRNGSVTIHELWISDTPFAMNFIDGDYNANGTIDAGDVKPLAAAFDSNDFYYDRSGDEHVNTDDLQDWVHKAANSWFGDANLDGEFSSKDFVDVFQAGKYETGQPAGWQEGDWNGDGVFSSGDFVTAFEDGGFELGPRAAVQSVPEPSSIFVALTGLIVFTRFRSRHNRRAHNVAHLPEIHRM